MEMPCTVAVWLWFALAVTFFGLGVWVGHRATIAWRRR